ncbi:S-layer homology domain-containing protein [Brevibacillus sp. B_LB10_24]|uniref:S-layer homology domain-containing protein n=1 Tax=Brevibacillus sp. B_LB10_24 TaxID=3380645 RepID=UPI0038BBD012
MVKPWKLSALFLAGLLAVPSFAAAQSTDEALPFNDIEQHWAKEAIVQSYEDGLLAGVGDGKAFEPDRGMTRGEFIALLDRLYVRSEQLLFPLTLMSGDERNGWGEGFDEPYLPYRDVSRLSWLYDPVLEISLVYDRLYGPGSFHQLFAGEQFQPQAVITHREAAELLQIFAAGSSAGRKTEALREMESKGWLTGEADAPVKRGEAALLAEQVKTYMTSQSVLPLLDLDGTRFPQIGEIEDPFPLFRTYDGQSRSADDKAYLEAVDAISEGYDDETTFDQLRKLAQSGYSNRTGVYYYLSWDYFSSYEENLEHAFSALNAYLADNMSDKELFNLLVVNVYDISLMLEHDNPGVFDRVRERLLTFHNRLPKEGMEAGVLSLYLAAFDVKAGDVDKAIDRYKAAASEDRTALQNALYYLADSGRTEEAKELLKTAANRSNDEDMKKWQRLYEAEFASLDAQKNAAMQLEQAYDLLNGRDGYKAAGEALVDGYLFKYTQQVDQKNKTAHTTGYYYAPDKLVLQKLETYADLGKKMLYSRDFDSEKWVKQEQNSFDYLHEWVESIKPTDRLSRLKARYFVQSIGDYDVITEWIEAEALLAKAKEVTSSSGKITNIPYFVSKYYIDRHSGMPVQRVWHVEEIYDEEQFVPYVGSERYEPTEAASVAIPADVVKGVSVAR